MYIYAIKLQNKSNDLHVFVLCLKLNLLKSSFFLMYRERQKWSKKITYKKGWEFNDTVKKVIENDL